MTYAPTNTESPYLPVSINFNNDEETNERILTQMYNSIALRLNNREIALYATEETVTGQKWTDTSNLQVQRETFRKVFEFSAIAAGATLNIPHNITTISSFTRFYGSITTAADDRPLPYTDDAAVTNQVSVKRVGANLVIINGATAPAITSGVLIVEYLKS